MNLVGWRWTFVVFAMRGVAWAIAFFIWFRDDPAEHHGTNEAERNLITAGRAVTTLMEPPAGQTSGRMARSPGGGSSRPPTSGC